MQVYYFSYLVRQKNLTKVQTFNTERASNCVSVSR